MGQLTTHVLDTANGIPASGIPGRLLDATGQTLSDFVTNRNGRCDYPLLEGEAFRSGLYTLLFFTGAYFRALATPLPEPLFLDEIPIRFGISDPCVHYHVPLLISPWSFSTYRGS
jgi:5-hydroxyisourate hydrolase